MCSKAAAREKLAAPGCLFSHVADSYFRFPLHGYLGRVDEQHQQFSSTALHYPLLP